MAITQVGTAQKASSNTGSATLTLTFDVSLQQDDVVYLFASNCGSMVTTGYTQIENNTDQKIYRKVMGASPDSNVQVSDGLADQACNAIAFAFRGIDPTTPEDTTPVNANFTNNPGSIITVTDGAVVIATATLAEDIATPGQPSGYSTVVEESLAGSSTSQSTAVCYKTVPVAGTEDPGAFSGYTAVTTFTTTLALRPAEVETNIIMQVANHGTFVSKRIVTIGY